ncbi:MAG: type VI secretion system tip protein TssI/VgrG [Planctomycetota bacterium]|nr:type VI secretion system tip protein TssI/VgrG [Planctomycetota bacterium]
MAKWTQANRAIGISTPLADDVLLLQGFSMTEELGRPFVAHLELRSEQGEIDPNAILGGNVTIRVNLPNGENRFINGFIARFSQEEYQGDEASNKFRATMVPWLWFLTRAAGCRIFQNKSVPDIVKQVFDDLKFTDYEFKTTGTYAEREYVVQYRETSFNFISRLLEEEGIYYWFKHENGKHTMILNDTPARHEPNEHYAEVKYVGDETSSVGEERVWDLSVEHQVQPGTTAMIDFDFTAPTKNLYVKREDPKQHPQAAFEIFDFPGRYKEFADGETYAAIRNEELACQHVVTRLVGNVRGITAGSKFTLTDYPLASRNAEYVCTSVSCSVQVDEYEMGKSGDGEGVFQSAFTCIPADVQFRPARTTPRPHVAGPQTAIVVGPDGEEIFTDPDAFGRVKVHFHWDWKEKADENCSCWVRVSQNWAGKRWGALFLPRVGQEVIVDFLEGDPDCPVITGRLYNKDNMPPYALPDNKTMSTIKTNSSKGGEGFNELRFEDKKGEEQIFMHAEKNFDLRVKNDMFVTVLHDRHDIVENDHVIHIKHDTSRLIDNDLKEEIANDRNVKVGGKEAVEIAGSKSLSVAGDVIEEFGGAMSTAVSGKLSIQADKIVLEGSTNITLQVGSSYIAIDSSSIDIVSTDITINGESSITGEAGSELKLEGGSSAELKGGSSLTCEGGSSAEFKGGSSATLDGGASTTVKGGSITVG